MRLFLLLLITLPFSGFTQAKKALFIGNSYTAFNNLPQLVRTLARSAGDSLLVDSHTPGGARLMSHASNAVVMNKIASDNWDFVVMQAQSQEPSFPAQQVQTEVFPFAAQLSDSIRANDVCTRPVFYMTWGRESGDQQNCAVWPPVCTYLGMDSILSQNYQIMADQNEGLVSPVGAVWRYIRQNAPTIDLYTSDGSHPSPAGSYAAACTFYAILFRQSPEQITDDFSLSAAEALTIRQAARAVAFDSLTQWRVGDYDPVADFSVDDSFNTFSFTNLSQSFDQFVWDFGDGSSSNLANPKHTYSQEGTFTVRLIVSQCGISDTLEQIVESQFNTTSVEPGLFALLRLSPHPFQAQFRILGLAAEQIQTVRLFTLSGQVMDCQFEAQTQTVLVSGISPGVYLLEIQLRNGQFWRQKVVAR